jgi:hypothetical protein
MALYMDRHDLPGATAEDVARAHVADLAIQDRFGVTYTTYWFDPVTESAFCLVHAPSKDAAGACIAKHMGWSRGRSSRLTSARFGSSWDRSWNPPGDPWVATAFRAVLFTDIANSTNLTQCLGDARAMQIVRDHDEVVRRAIELAVGRSGSTLGTASWRRSCR